MFQPPVSTKLRITWCEQKDVVRGRRRGLKWRRVWETLQLFQDLDPSFVRVLFSACMGRDENIFRYVSFPVTWSVLVEKKNRKMKCKSEFVKGRKKKQNIKTSNVSPRSITTRRTFPHPEEGQEMLLCQSCIQVKGSFSHVTKLSYWSSSGGDQTWRGHRALHTS